MIDVRTQDTDSKNPIPKVLTAADFPEAESMWWARAEAGKYCVHLEFLNTNLNLNIKCVVMGPLKEALTVE